MDLRYEVILFDADGTLLDFKAAEKLAVKKTLKENGYPHDEEVISVYSNINEKLWEDLELKKVTKEELLRLRFERLFEHYGLSGDPVFINSCYQENLGFGSHTIPDAKEICEYLSDKCKMHIVTNGNTKTQKSRFKGSELNEYFPKLIISEEAGYHKPDKRFFDYAFEKIGIVDKSKVLIIGDSLSADIKGGNDYGIDTCWFNPEGLENKSENKATYEIRDLMEIKLLI